MDWEPIHKEFIIFVKEFFSWIGFRLQKGGLHFESVKNFIVDILMVRRCANTSLFIHLGILALAFSALFGGGILLSSSVVSGSYPGVAVNPLVAAPAGETADAGVVASAITPVTIISDKPRDKVIEYEVKVGDTVSSIAQEFAVSEETILWENELNSKSTLKEKDEVEILPVSGVAHKVVSGDTLDSVAKKYRASSQAMLDFPFNNIGEDLALAVGDMLIVPDGADRKSTRLNSSHSQI